MVEVQIRTREMHRTAESGVAAHYIYKQGGEVDEELDAKLGGFLAATADWQKSASDDEYMDFLRTALYQEEVFVYTPRRELKRLAKGSTRARLRVPDPHRGGSAHRRRARERRAGADPLRTAQRRHRRDHDLGAGAPARGLAADRAHHRRAHQDPPVAARAAARRQRRAGPRNAGARIAPPAPDAGRSPRSPRRRANSAARTSSSCTRASPRGSARSRR